MRPFVYINMAMSVDGKITTASREYPKMTSRLDRDTMDRLRADADAVLIGAQTLRADHPNLHVRSAAMQQLREQNGHSGGLLKVIVTGSGELPADSRSLKDPDQGGVLIATTDQADHPSLAEIAERAEIGRFGSSQVDLPRLLEDLYDRGIRRLLVEGGAELNGQFFEQGLVDEMFITIAPSILGGRDAPTPVGGQGFAMADQTRLELVSVERAEDELYLRYRVQKRPA